MKAAGRSRRAQAISMPGSDLSQPAMATRPSIRSACITSSTESAITSRLTSDAFMPSWPMAMASETAMVPNSSGTPPARRTPALAASASLSRWMLQGVTSFQDEATPTWDRSKSSSVKPTARSMERAPARSRPTVTSVERGRAVVDGIGGLLMAGAARFAAGGVHHRVDERHLAGPVGVAVEAEAAGQAALQLAVLLGRLRVGPQVVAEQHVLLPEVARHGDHVDVMGLRHAAAEVAPLGELALQLRDVLVAEVDEAGDGLAGPLDVGHADHDVDHRLGREAGHRRTADVLDGDGALAEGGGDAVALLRVPQRPTGVVGDDLDGLRPSRRQRSTSPLHDVAFGVQAREQRPDPLDPRATRQPAPRERLGQPRGGQVPWRAERGPQGRRRPGEPGGDQQRRDPQR